MKRKLLVMFFILAMLSSASSISPYYAEEEAPTPAISGEKATPAVSLGSLIPIPMLSDTPALAQTGEGEGDLSTENNSDAAFSGRDNFYMTRWPAEMIYGGQKVVFTCSGMPTRLWELTGEVDGTVCFWRRINQKGSFNITIDVSRELSEAAGKVVRFYAYDLDSSGNPINGGNFLCASLLTTEISVSAPDEIYTGEVFEGVATPYAFVTVSIPGKYSRTVQAGADGAYAAECPENALAGETLTISADNGFVPPAETSVLLLSREEADPDGLSIVKWPKRYYSAEDPTLRMVGARKAGEKVFVTLEAEDAAFTLEAQDYGEDHWIFEANASDLAGRLGIALGAVSVRAHYAKTTDGPGCTFYYRLRQDLGTASNRYLGSPIYGSVRPGTPVSITIRRPLAGGTYQIIDWAEIVSGPTAQYVLSAYSQSAQIGDQILIQIADNDLVFGDDRIDTFVAPRESTDPGVPVITRWSGPVLYQKSGFWIEGTATSSTYVYCQITAPGVDPVTIYTRSNSDGYWTFSPYHLPGDTVDGAFMGLFNAYPDRDVTFTIKFGGLNAQSVSLTGHVYRRYVFDAPTCYAVGKPITFLALSGSHAEVRILRDGALFKTLTPSYKSDGQYALECPEGVQPGDIARIVLANSEYYDVKFVEADKLAAPVTADWPEAATLGRYDSLTVSGAAEPGYDVRLFLSAPGVLKEFIVRTDASGNFQKTLYAANDLVPFRDRAFTVSAGYWNGTEDPGPTFDYRYTAALVVPREIPASGVITGTAEAQATVGLAIRGADGILLHQLSATADASGAFSFERPQGAAEGQRLTFSVVDSRGNTCVQQRVFGPLDPIQKQEITLDTPTATFGRGQSLSLSGACAAGASVKVTAFYEDGTSEEFTAAVNGGRYSLVRAMEPAFAGRRDQIIRLVPHYADEDYGPVARVQYKYTALLSLTGDLVASRTVRGISESNRTLTFSIPSIGYTTNAYASLSGRFQVTCPIEALEGADAVLSFTDAYTNPGTLSVKVKDPAPITLDLLPEGPYGADKWLSLQGTREPDQRVYVTYGLSGGTLTKVEAYYPEAGRWGFSNYMTTLSGIGAPATGQVQFSFAYKARTGQPIHLDYDYLIRLDLPAYGLLRKPIIGVTDPGATVQLYYSGSSTPTMTAMADEGGGFSFDTSSLSIGANSTLKIVATDPIQNTLTKYITMRQPVQTLTLNAEEHSIKAGDTYQLNCTALPTNAYNKSVVWASSDSEVATVDATGLVTAKKRGAAIVTAAANDGAGATASCSITVWQQVNGVSLDRESATVDAGKTIALAATVVPGDANDPSVLWSSENTAVATVDQTGLVTGVGRGATRIIARSNSNTSVFADCDVDVIQKVTGIEVDSENSVSKVPIGTALTLSASVQPDNANDASVTWSSGDASIATVDQDGVVTGVSKGTVIITATANDGSGVSASCEIIVIQYATGLALDQTEETLYTGETLTLTPMVSPSDASDKGVSWWSSDTTVATVEDGVVTALKAGAVTITATTTDGSEKSAACEITVKQYATGLTLDRSSATLYTGGTLTLFPTVSPSYASDKGVSWASSDEAVATVEDGAVTAHQAGVATITASTVDGSEKTVSCEITVKQYVTGLTLDMESAMLHTGDTLALIPTVSPSDASYKGVSWASSDETVATVNSAGVVTAVRAGAATITATAADGSGKSDSTTITIYDPVTGVSVNPTGATMYVNDTLTLAASVSTSTAGKDVTWASSKPSVASVDQSGKVTAVGPGTANITATAKDDTEFQAPCQVTVYRKAESIRVYQYESLLFSLQQIQMHATIEPDGSNPAVTWSSSNETVATVDADGLFTPKRAGTVTITASTVDGTGLSNSVTFNIVVPVTDVSVNPPSATMYVNDTLTLSATVSPSKASQGVLWTSSDPFVASVDENGKVTAVGPGTASITARHTWYAKSGYCHVTVYQKASGIQINEREADRTGLAPFELTATLQPEVGVNPIISWSSSDETVATVGADGVVTPMKAGTVTITASTMDGSGCSDSIGIRLWKDFATGVEMSQTSLVMYPGDALPLTASVSPSTANPSLDWASGNTSIATVSQSGLVSAIAPGTVYITSKASDGSGKSASCQISVKRLVTGISLGNENATLYVGNSYSLTAMISPSDASDQRVTWTSSNEAVATVVNGVVTPRKAGSATITATAADGSGKYATCQVTVKQYATGLTLDRSSATLYTGGELTLIPTVSPSDTSDKRVTWASNDDAVATVSSSGVVTALKAGSATIIVTTADGSEQSATCEITVKQYVTGVTLDKPSAMVYTGQSLTLTPTISPSDASDKSVTWASGNDAVATVVNGVVTAKKAGSVTITAIAADGSGKYATCQVTVKQYATGLTLDRSSATLYTGGTVTLIPTVSPSDTSDKGISWASSDEAIATVSASGVVTALKAGSATITASTVDGSEKNASCEITVKQYVTGVTLDKPSATVYTGQSLTLTPTISPSDASDRGVTWASSNDAVATVVNGVVTARKAGSVTITATAADGSGKSASCQITVKQYATGVALDKNSATLYTGGELTLQATVSPGDTSDKRVTWASNDDAVATVSSSGVVTALKAGSATISATTADGSGKSASCEITVKQYVTGVTLDKPSATVYTGQSLTLTPTISPSDASDKSANWASSNDAVATVVNGVVTARKAGSVTITATAADGSGKSASCQITVKQYATDVALDKNTATLYTGAALTLNATISPVDASNKGVTWTSGDNAVATVSASGVVTAVKAGTAAITATAADGSKKSATCQVTVWAPASGVTLGPVMEAMLKPGDVLTLSADVQPADAHDRSVTWGTNNASVARVQGGAVTAVARGMATITATTHNGKTATCMVTVEDRVVDVDLRVPADTPGLNGVYDLRVGVTLQIGAIVQPQGIGHTLAYKSSDGKVASVSSTGLVKGLKNGQATITVTAKDSKGLASKSETLKVSVFTPVGNVALPGEAQMLTGATKKLTATISPSSASDKALEWDGDNDAVATVAQDGTVTALKQGTVNITATAANGKAASCLVRVTDRATGVQVATETATATGKVHMDYKKDLQLTATVSPVTASGAVTWKSSNTTYVTVDATGKVYGRKVGKATVYATAADGSGVRGSIEIQVITPMTVVNLPETDKVFVGKTKKLVAALTPSSPTFKTLIWKSDNEAVATVAADGTVTAKALGTAVITATAYNNLSDSCTVTVAQPVTDITITPPKNGTVVYKGETATMQPTVTPGNANDQGVTWKSSNEKYARVNEKGEVTGRNPGKVKITATAKDGSGVTGSISLTIVAPATAIKLNKSSAVLYHNGTGAQKTLQLTATASPKGSVYQSLTWSVLSGDAATVDETTGIATALKDGTAVIRVETDKGYTADCTVTVRTLPTTFSLKTTEKTLAFKQSFDLGAEDEADFDAGCTEKALTWKSSNTKVATVSSAGVVKASKNKTGTTTITATTKNGKSATCKITVVKSLPKGATGTPAAEAAAPRIALKLTGGGYATSDAHVANVGGSGKVELKSDGTAMLEAGGKQIAVKVEEGSLAEMKMDEGTNLTISADTNVKWTVKDGEIVAIDEDGHLTARSKGTTTLTCNAGDGGEWTIRIVVTRPEEVEPQPNPEPSAETEQILPEPTPETEPTAAPEPTPAIEPTATPEPELSAEPEPTAKPEPEKTPEPEKEPDPEPAPAPTDTGVPAGAEG